MAKRGQLIQIFTCCLILFFQHDACTSFAQASRGMHEYEAGAGYSSLYNILENGLSRGSVRYRSSGIYQASLRYYLRRRFTLGACVAYEQVAGGSVHEMFLTIAPQAGISYIDRPICHEKLAITLYGLISAGVSFYKDLTENEGLKPFPNIQLSPIGIRAGRALAGFAEVGIGYKGLINAGVCYRPGKRIAHVAK